MNSEVKIVSPRACLAAILRCNRSNHGQLHVVFIDFETDPTNDREGYTIHLGIEHSNRDIGRLTMRVHTVAGIIVKLLYSDDR